MKTEHILMCVLFVACTALVVGSMVAMLGADVAPIRLASDTAQSLPLASFGVH